MSTSPERALARAQGIASLARVANTMHQLADEDTSVAA